MVEESELVIENVYGDFDRAEFDEYSEEMIFICRKPA